jgi:hypothetical protein
MNRYARQLRGSTVEELKKEVQDELRTLYDMVNKLEEMLDSAKTGEAKSSDTSQTIRLIQSKDGYYVEGRFQDGWARLSTSFDQIGKK